VVRAFGLQDRMRTRFATSSRTWPRPRDGRASRTACWPRPSP
jgi:hypothetical protein